MRIFGKFWFALINIIASAQDFSIADRCYNCVKKMKVKKFLVIWGMTCYNDNSRFGIYAGTAQRRHYIV